MGQDRSTEEHQPSHVLGGNPQLCSYVDQISNSYVSENTDKQDAGRVDPNTHPKMCCHQRGNKDV